jgi:hypothetical protein
VRFANLLVIDVERRGAALSRSAAIVLEIDADRSGSWRQFFRARDLGAFLREPVVHLDGLPILHVQGIPRDEAARGH